MANLCEQTIEIQPTLEDFSEAWDRAMATFTEGVREFVEQARQVAISFDRRAMRRESRRTGRRFVVMPNTHPRRYQWSPASARR